MGWKDVVRILGLANYEDYLIVHSSGARNLGAWSRRYYLTPVRDDVLVMGGLYDRIDFVTFEGKHDSVSWRRSEEAKERAPRTAPDSGRRP